MIQEVIGLAIVLIAVMLVTLFILGATAARHPGDPTSGTSPDAV